MTNYDSNEEATVPSSTNRTRTRRSVLRAAGISSLSFVLGALVTGGLFVITSPSEIAAEISQAPSIREPEQAQEPAEEDDTEEPLENASEDTYEDKPEAFSGDSATAGSAQELGTISGFPEESLVLAYELAAKMRGSVVQVFGVDNGFETGAGTGFLVEPDVIATNDHVIDFGSIDTDIFVRTIDGEVMKGELIDTDSYGDVAFVRLPRSIDAEIFQISTEMVEVGEPVIAVGHPGMIGNWVTMAGVVTKVSSEYWMNDSSRKYRDVDTSLPTSPGSSGSAITRLDGVVVAINSRKSGGEISDDDWKPTDDGFVHTFIPRADNNGGVSSASIIRLAEEADVELQLVD